MVIFCDIHAVKKFVDGHLEHRYACYHKNCAFSNAPLYFSTWSALQTHNHDVHPPTCTHASCNGKTFTAQKGLRAHLKLHEQQEVENALILECASEMADDEGEFGPPRKRRRGGELGRDWVCEEEGCGKNFKSVSDKHGMAS